MALFRPDQRSQLLYDSTSPNNRGFPYYFDQHDRFWAKNSYPIIQAKLTKQKSFGLGKLQLHCASFVVNN